MNNTHIQVIDAFLFLYVILIARSREIRWYQATLIAMFGFLLAGTPFSTPMWWMVSVMGSYFFG